MAIDTVVDSINVDNSADNGKVPIYNASTKKFEINYISNSWWAFTWPIPTWAEKALMPSRTAWTEAQTANRMQLIPVTPAQTITINRIYFTVTSTNGNAKMLIYSDNNWVPDALLHDSGSIVVAADTIRNMSDTTLYAWITYWIGARFSWTPTIRTMTAATSYGFRIINVNQMATVKRAAVAFGTTPNPAPAMTNENAQTPLFLFRVA